MEAVLATKGVAFALEAVKPEEADATVYQQWVKADKEARAMLLLGLKFEIVKSVVHLKTAKEVWEKLKQLHEKKTAANLIQIQQDFYNAKKGPQESISTYASRIESIASCMKDFGEQVSDQSLNSKIVHGLPTEYKHFISSWLATSKDNQTYDNLLSRLQAEEAIIKGTETEKSVALNVKVDKNRTFDKRRKNRKDIQCYYCHKDGHFKKDCRLRKKEESKKEGHRDGGNCDDGRSLRDSGSALSAKVLSADTDCDLNRESWFMDSGASRHMTMNRHWLRDYKEYQEHVPVRVGNNDLIYGKGSGKVDAISYIGKKQTKVTIYDVMYVPDISNNLFSAGQADERGLTHKGSKGKITFLDGNKAVATGQKVQGNLYRMNLKVPAIANIAKKERTLEEWHEVIGHASLEKLKQMESKGSVDGFKIVSTSKGDGCGSCQLGKGRKASHGDSGRIRADEILHRVHMDLVGPITPPSMSGSKYFMLLRDEYSTYTFARFFSHKSHVLNSIRTFVNDVTTLTQKKVKIFRSDNGTEFKNQGMKVFCEFEGIQQEFSAPNTPQQNGEIERANRTILETARSMCQASKLTLSIWAEAVNAAVYIRNRVPNKRTGERTPYELFHGRKPDLSNLMKFGQEVHVLDSSRGISKFSAKTKEAYIVGFGERFNTYRCLMADSTEVLVTADVYAAKHSVGRKEQLQRNRPWITFMIERSESEIESGEAPEEETSQNTGNTPRDCRRNSSTIDLQSEDDDAARRNCTQEVSLPPLEHTSTQENEHLNSFSRIPVRVATAPAEESAPEVRTVDDAQIRADRIATDASTSGVQQKSTVEWILKDREPRNTKSVYAKRPFSAKVAYTEPKSFDEAVEAEDAKNWREAIRAELEAHKTNKTWEIVPRSRDMNEISAKWIFKVKHDSRGNIERYKARLVARGFTQVEGVDYNEIFAPVVRMDSVRLLISLCVQFDLKYRQFDIATAFLNGKIEEELYLTPPEGLKVAKDYTCRLKKSLYGLKQSPRCWNTKFAEMLKIFDMKQTASDPCVYVATEPDLIYLAIYVDDGLVLAKNQKIIDRLFGYLTKHFEVRTVDSSCFIGVEIRDFRSSDGSIYLNQRGYIRRILERFNMLECKVVSTPIETGHSLNKPETLKGEILTGIPYAEAVGSLMYCALATRPDLAQALSILSKYNSCPREQHWQGVKRVLRYLKGTLDFALAYRKVNEPKIICYTDADWAGDHANRRSISGMVSFLSSGPISYKSQQQPVVALSTTESEYIAATIAVKELIWLQRFISELKAPISTGATLKCDNQSAIRLIRNPEFHQRTKHIDIRYHFIRERYLDKCFEPEYVDTQLQKADIFTKPLSTDKFQSLRDMISCIMIRGTG